YASFASFNTPGGFVMASMQSFAGSGPPGFGKSYKNNIWRSPAFVRLWSGQTVSLFGSEITAIALPLTAALVLGATPPEMGALIAAEALLYALIGLVAGVWVDRVRRRPLLLVADVLRALLLGSIVLAALLNSLSIL